MEADIDKKYGDYLAQYLAAGFSTKQVGNTYNVISNGLEQVMTLAILIVGALLVMQNDGFTVGMLVAFQMFAGRMSQPLLRLVGLWQEFQQANIAVQRLGYSHHGLYIGDGQVIHYQGVNNGLLSHS
jgi:subfamily B ATP-binding cassette protein HlyB/CyaB